MATTSPKFTLQALDFLKSLAVAALSQPILVILTSLAAGSFTINWTEQWHLAVSAGAAYLIKNFFSGVTPPTSGSSTSMTKIVIIFLVCTSAVASGWAQSPFKPEPKIVVNHPNAFARATVAQPDSIVNAWRFSVPVSPVGYTLAGVYQASAGLAYGFQKQDYNFTTQQYTVLWSLSGVVIPIQTGMPIRSIKDVANFGILVGGLTQKIGLPSNSINIGPFYNVNAPGTFRDKFGFWLTGTVNLN